MLSLPVPDPNSPFNPARRQGHLVLIADGGIRIDEAQAVDPPPVEIPPCGTLDSSITPKIAAMNAGIIANDNRPLVIQLLSGLISAITVAGEAYRFARSIPGAVYDSYQRATAPL